MYPAQKQLDTQSPRADRGDRRGQAVPRRARRARRLRRARASAAQLLATLAGHADPHARRRRPRRLRRRARLQQLRLARRRAGNARGRGRGARGRASRSSTPRTSTATAAAARSCSARRSKAAATAWSSRRSSGTRCPDDAPPNRGSREYVRVAIEASLKRLRTDVVDLYQYHRPDGVTPIEETLGAMSELVDEGKVRFIGSSNFDAALIGEADELARERSWHRFVSAQNEYSLLERSAEEELLPVCERLGVGVLPYFPLASGLLTGKYRRGEPAPAGTRLAMRPERLTDEVVRRDRGARGVRDGARPHAARARVRRAARAACRVVSDRRARRSPSKCARTPQLASGSSTSRTCRRFARCSTADV